MGQHLRECLIDEMVRELLRQSQHGEPRAAGALMFRRFAPRDGSHLALVDGTIDLNAVAAAIEKLLETKEARR